MWARDNDSQDQESHGLAITPAGERLARSRPLRPGRAEHAVERPDELGCAQLQLGEVRGRELAQEGVATRRDRDASTTSIVGRAIAADQLRCLEAIEQLDDRVVLEHELFGDHLHGRLGALGEASQCEQQLVLARLDPDTARGGLGERDEAAQLVAEGRECSVVGIGHVGDGAGGSHASYISHDDIFGELLVGGVARRTARSVAIPLHLHAVADAISRVQHDLVAFGEAARHFDIEPAAVAEVDLA